METAFLFLKGSLKSHFETNGEIGVKRWGSNVDKFSQKKARIYIKNKIKGVD